MMIVASNESTVVYYSEYTQLTRVLLCAKNIVISAKFAILNSNMSTQMKRITKRIDEKNDVNYCLLFSPHIPDM
jgi:hypothetical protein